MEKEKDSFDEEKRLRALEDISDIEEECEWTPQEDKTTFYPPEKIKKFLLQTKGSSAVKTELFFSDLKGFVKFVTRLRKETNSFSDQEIYCPKKLVTKVSAQLIEDDDLVRNISPR